MANQTLGRVVVCAAIRNRDGLVICSARHYDRTMRIQIKNSIGDWRLEYIEQGFIDQFGLFLTREEALLVANDAGQIVRRVGGDKKGLFSENLY